MYLNEQAWIFWHVFQTLQVDTQLWRLNTLSSIVVYYFYRKSKKETINEAERKESSKSYGEFIRKAITFLCGYLSLCGVEFLHYVL